MRFAVISLCVMLAVAALFCAAVMARLPADGQLVGNGAMLISRPGPATDMPKSMEPPQHSAAGPAAAPAGTNIDPVDSRRHASVQEFRDWFRRYLESNPDRGELRDELRSALAQLADGNESDLAESAAEFDALRRTEQSAGTEYTVVLDASERFLENYPDSPFAPEARALFDRVSHARDEHDFELARQYSRENPDRFELRIKRYQEYLEQHAAAGIFAADARRAIESIRMDWSEHDYRAIVDFWRTYPNDVAAVATRLRRFEATHPSSARAPVVAQFLTRYEKAAAPGEYRIRVKSGSFERSIGHLLSFGPDLAVEIEVAGVRLGRTPIVADSFEPVWDYEFPQSARWRMGDPVKIRVTDFDYSNRTILKFDSGDDPLALRYLNGVTSSGGHRLTIECNFDIPTLPDP